MCYITVKSIMVKLIVIFILIDECLTIFIIKIGYYFNHLYKIYKNPYLIDN